MKGFSAIFAFAMLLGAVEATKNFVAIRGGGTASSKTPSGPLNTFIQTVVDARRHLASAAVARSSSIFAMYPVDTVKTRMQMEQAQPFRTNGLYKGVWGSLAGQVPYGVLTFGSYEVYKEKLLKRFPGQRPAFMYALAAVMGDLTGSGILCPSEVVKQKLQAGIFKSTREAISGIWRKSGMLGFYEGYIGGITRDVPFRVTQLTTYEITKNAYLRVKRRRLEAQRDKRDKREITVELSPIESASCGALAGSLSAAITSPLDRIKTLMMTDSAAYGGNVAACAAKIFREEGARGLFTGIVPRVAYIAPSVVIFFIAYEETQKRLKNW